MFVYFSSSSRSFVDYTVRPAVIMNDTALCISLLVLWL